MGGQIVAEITERQMAWHIAHSFGIRQNICVPNLSWGMGFWEIDLAVLTKSGYLWEVEIKCSIADLKADKLKTKWRNPHFMEKFEAMISRYYIAVPKYLAEKVKMDDLQPCAGLLSVDPDAQASCLIVQQIRPTSKKNGRKLTDAERLQLARLGTMRYWSECERQFKSKIVV